MRVRFLVFSATVAASAGLVSSAALARVDVGVNLGVPAPVYVAPAPVYTAPPPPPPAVYEQPAPVYGAPVYGAPIVVGPPPVAIGWYGDRYWDGHRYWDRREWREHRREHGRHDRDRDRGRY